MSSEDVRRTGSAEGVALQKLAASASRGMRQIQLGNSYEFVTDTTRRWKLLRQSSENMVMRDV